MSGDFANVLLAVGILWVTPSFLKVLLELGWVKPAKWLMRIVYVMAVTVAVSSIVAAAVLIVRAVRGLV